MKFVKLVAVSALMTIILVSTFACSAPSRIQSHTPTPTTVTLTIYVHDGSASGPIISGASVMGSDASGTSFSQTTNSEGYFTITGTSGVWQFSVSKPGYQTYYSSQIISSTCTRDPYLTAITPINTPTLASPLCPPVTVSNKAKWTVLAVKDRGQVLHGSNSFTEDKTTTGKFIEVTYIVENVGKQPVDYVDEPTLVDSQGREFSFMMFFGNYVPDGMALGIEMLGGDLQPNIPKQAMVIFEVAKDATGFQLKVNGFGYCPWCVTDLISLECLGF